MKPILFNSEMVRAILENRKTVTRRVVKPPPEKCAHSPYECCGGRFAFRIGDRACTNQYKPPYCPGDILWVREAFWKSPNGEYTYKSDYNQAERLTWRPSIHMPREAARIFLRVTEVRVERLQGITEEQSEKEGCTAHGGNLALDEFEEVWHRTLKPADRVLYGWEANPYVWAIEFEQCKKPEVDWTWKGPQEGGSK